MRADTMRISQADNVQLPKGLDGLFLLAVFGLLCFGLVMVFSATVSVSKDTLEINYGILIKHSVHAFLGVCIMFAVSFINIEYLQRYSKQLLLFGFALLTILLIPGVGVEINGSLRWFDVGGFRFQPSELMKIIAIVYFADYLARKKEDLHLFKVGIINVGLVVGIIGALLLMEPDFGTTVVITVTVAAMMFVSGVKIWHFMISIAVAALLMWFLLGLESYRVARLLSYRDPWADPFGSGFQLVNALIAIGRGEWFGVGLGSSIQKLFYLPHAGNDFIISIVGEELGALGIFCVMGLFLLFFFRCLSIARRAFTLGHRFAGHVVQGVGLLLTFQAGVHIGVNTGLLPTKGLTLPLISYGGSSLLMTMMAIGLVVAVDRQVRGRLRPGMEGRR